MLLLQGGGHITDYKHLDRVLFYSWKYKPWKVWALMNTYEIESKTLAEEKMRETARDWEPALCF